jgi:chaperone modulatory protein CbpM
MNEKRLIPIGEILDETIELTLNDMAQRCAVETRIVIEMVEEGVLEPQGRRPEEWQFRGPDLIRLRRALRLQQDLEVNLPGIALTMDLLEELDELRARLRMLERQFLQ